MERQVLAQVMSASGVKVTAEDAESVAKALERIEGAARLLVRSATFEVSVEDFGRVLASGAAKASNR